MVAVVGACAVAGLALLIVVIVVLRRRHTPPTQRPHSGGFTVDTSPADPVEAAITALVTEQTGAPTTELAEHPQTGNVHLRRRRRTKQKTTPPSARHHTPTPGVYVDDTFDHTDATSAPVAGRVTPANPDVPESADWKHAFSARHTVWFIHVAETTSDPTIAAAAWALASITATNTSHPNAQDICTHAATLAPFTLDNPYLQPFRRHLRHTVTIGTQQLTAATPVTWLYIAAADHAYHNNEDPSPWLAQGPRRDPVFVAMKARSYHRLHNHWPATIDTLPFTITDETEPHG